MLVLLEVYLCTILKIWPLIYCNFADPHLLTPGAPGTPVWEPLQLYLATILLIMIIKMSFSLLLWASGKSLKLVLCVNRFRVLLWRTEESCEFSRSGKKKRYFELVQENVLRCCSQIYPVKVHRWPLDPIRMTKIKTRQGSRSTTRLISFNLILKDHLNLKPGKWKP